MKPFDIDKFLIGLLGTIALGFRNGRKPWYENDKFFIKKGNYPIHRQ